MDLHLAAGEPSAAERAAVDAVVGAAPAEHARAVRGGHEARARRDLLLPALWALQQRVGWISQEGLGYVCRRLTVPPAEAYGVATFYALLSVEPQPASVVHVCDDVACRMAGAEGLCREVGAAVGGDTGFHRSPCLGLCEQAPAALVVRAGERPTAVSFGAATAARVQDALAGKPVAGAVPRLEDVRHFVPQVGTPAAAGLRLLARVGVVDPGDHAAWVAAGGLMGLRAAVAAGREGTIAEVIASRLVGRGGAAFPTGKKWEAAAAQPWPRELVCNADESEPGTFKDRVLLEWDPFAVLEGMVIAGWAIGAARGWLYLRGEYPLAAARVEAALAAARAAGWLGKDVLGTGWSFDIELRRGAGAYICGEETALFNSIEGKRGEPRAKPPFPTVAGLFGRPTVVQNVETLANVPLVMAGGAGGAGGAGAGGGGGGAGGGGGGVGGGGVVADGRGGGARFAAGGAGASTGPKLYCVSGRVARPGLYEHAFGVTLGGAIAAAGGVVGGGAARAVLMGGAAGSFVGPEMMDVPLTFEALRAAGASLGSGVIMVVDDLEELPGLLRRIAQFFRDESCGQCVPCRVGTVRQEEALVRLGAAPRAGAAAGDARTEARGLLGELGRVMRDASICGLGHTASTAVESGLALLERAGKGLP